MGKHNGSWSPIYGQAWDHAKTKRAANHAQIAARVKAEIAPFLVLGWLNRLCLWCLANSEAGIVGGLSDVRIATVAWPEAVEAGAKPSKAGAIIRSTLRAGGFLEGEGAAEAIHDFKDHHYRVLRERARKRQDAEGGAEDSAERSAEPGAESSAEPGATTGTGTGNGNGIGTRAGPRSPPQPGSGPAPTEGEPEPCIGCRNAPRAPGRAYCAGCAAEVPRTVAASCSPPPAQLRTRRPGARKTGPLRAGVGSCAHGP